MKPENAIEVHEVRKYFKVYKDKGHMLRERVVHFNRNRYEKREVLKGISFSVKKGESVGLIGKNGCGKSTTLKLLTKILRPNGGNIEIQGRVCSLIELGAGFHPDMSGRENIYINASIFGIKAKEVDRRLNDIIRFSELEEFIDNPVRTYSSGMYMRLAFSVAINVDADILLIDEILAVGDNAFQTKCFNKLKSLKDAGTTIVIVSHALGQVEKLCDRAIWIDEGVIRKDGPARQICREYLECTEAARLERAELEYRLQLEDAKKREEEKKKQEEEKKKQQTKEQARLLEEERKKYEEEEREHQKREAEKKRNATCREIAAQSAPAARRTGAGEIQFTEIEMLDAKGQRCVTFHKGETITLHMKYENPLNIKEAMFVVNITRGDWIYCYGVGNIVTLRNKGEVMLTFPNLPLLPASYYLDFRIQDVDEKELDVVYSLIEFRVVKEEERSLQSGIAELPHNWKMLK